jgi:hypothetical protein
MIIMETREITVQLEPSLVEVDKIGSATSPLHLARVLQVTGVCEAPRAGDVIVVRVLTDNATYNMLELPAARTEGFRG